MSTTTNYGLNKPAQADFYNVEDFNENMDTLDEEMKKREDAIASIMEVLGDKDLSGLVIPTLTALADYCQGVGEASKLSLAGFHNSFYRGKYLGTQLTDAQSAVIRAGTFKDLYIGDYWTINGVNWRIAHFDYWYQTGDTNCNTHHVVVVPDSVLYDAQMNETNITTGGYPGSKMYTANLATAKSAVIAAFGSGHVLTHRSFIANAMTNGYPSAAAWMDSQVDLMTEEMVYGSPQHKPHSAYASGTNIIIPWNHTVENRQLRLFALDPQRVVAGRHWWWLRDPVGASAFANVNGIGHSNYYNASNSGGVRPAIAIY